MEIFSKFLILDNEWQRKSQPQSQVEPERAATGVSQTLMHKFIIPYGPTNFYKQQVSFVSYIL